jgi:hypothetical protein
MKYRNAIKFWNSESDKQLLISNECSNETENF